MTPREVSKELRLVQEKHKGDFTPTFNVIISDMARDAANAIDTLLAATDKTITICGSTRFKEEFLKAQRDLTFDGWIVFSVPFFEYADGIVFTHEQKDIAVKSHLRKIAVSNAIYVINKDGYIDESTRNEIQYARDLGKEVIFMENLKDLRKDGYDSLAYAVQALNQFKKDLNAVYGKSPSEGFLNKKFNLPTSAYPHLIDPDLYRLAYTDALTGCFNRNMLEKTRPEFDQKRLTIIMIDLDNFKKYNTDYGHIGGDRRLQEVANILKRKFSLVYRLGGDEFLVITEQDRSRDFMNSIGGLSCGIYNKHTSESLSSAMHKADLLMYMVKTKKQEDK